jgi:HEAT repeat protein
LLHVGDIDGASHLINLLSAEIKGETQNKPAAESALFTLVQGSMMVHITSHLKSVDEATVEQLKEICYAVGPAVVRPLAEALAVEKRTMTRQRLTQLLLGFGAAGRQSVEQLKASANPAVRRTAVHLLREFGGTEALPDLTALLDDAEPHIQREAVRAILMIGTEEAYAELQKALVKATDRSRDALVTALIAMRSERAIPLFEFIVSRFDRKGPLREVYLRAVESLGALKAEASVDLLKEALYAGDFWSPFRTAEARRTVASALRQIGTATALRVLEDAASSGPRGVRAAVKAAHA